MTMPDDATAEPTNRRARITGLVAMAAIFGISIASIFGGELLQSSEAERNRAPELDLTLLSSGKPVRLAQKNPLVVRFVENGCSTCSEDLAVLDASRRRWDGKVNYVVVVAADPQQVRGTFGEVDPSIQVAAEPGLGTARAFGVDKLPATVFVAADGGILERAVGPLRTEALERRIRAAIAEGPG